jgi:murein DD-endopeptidase MepM/ murein hydrolase activator NlpD
LSLLAGGRLVLFAWSWRRPLVGSIAAGFGLWLLGAAALAVEAPSRAKTAVALLDPLSGGRLTQPFGCTDYPREPWSESCPSHHFHSGIDLAAPAGTAVVAATAGIARVGHQREGYGLYLFLVRDSRVATLYGHLLRTDVKTGDQVIAGEQVGAVGSSGNSSGPHLHFELRLDGVPVDPLPALGAVAGGGA